MKNLKLYENFDQEETSESVGAAVLNRLNRNVTYPKELNRFIDKVKKKKDNYDPQPGDYIQTISILIGNEMVNITFNKETSDVLTELLELGLKAKIEREEKREELKKKREKDELDQNRDDSFKTRNSYS